MNGQPISILLFADSILGIKTLYDWQAKILLNYEAGNQTAAACANFTGKTSTVFPIAALWTLYNFPRARVMYVSATDAQVRNQFFFSRRSASPRHIAGSNADGDESRWICFRYNRAVLTKEAKDRVGPILRRIPARVVGVGFRLEHVKDR